MQLEGFVEVSAILRSGVYALVRNGVVIYVGQSKSMYQRIYSHRTTANRAARGKKIPTWMPIKGFVFDEVWVMPVHVDRLDEVEAEMINRYKPKFNESLKTRHPTKLPTELVINGQAVKLAQPEGMRRI